MWCRVDITKQHFVIVNGWTSSRCRARSTLQGNVSPDLCFARKSLMAADILNLTKFYGIRFTTKTQIKFITRTLLEKLKLQTFAQSWLYNTTCKSISRAEQRGEKLGLWRLEVWRGGGIYIQFILHISCIYLYIYICTDVSTLSIVFSYSCSGCSGCSHCSSNVNLALKSICIFSQIIYLQFLQARFY